MGVQSECENPAPECQAWEGQLFAPGSQRGGSPRGGGTADPECSVGMVAEDTWGILCQGSPHPGYPRPEGMDPARVLTKCHHLVSQHLKLRKNGRDTPRAPGARDGGDTPQFLCWPSPLPQGVPVLWAASKAGIFVPRHEGPCHPLHLPGGAAHHPGLPGLYLLWMLQAPQPAEL